MPPKASCMWSKSELARQTGSERLDGGGKLTDDERHGQQVQYQLYRQVADHVKHMAPANSIACYHGYHRLGQPSDLHLQT